MNMKSLVERHAERAQRKADNAAESTNNTTGGLGNAANAIATANAALGALTPEQREELFATMKEQGFAPTEAEGNSTQMAGIGIVNPFAVSTATLAEHAATDAQKGVVPELSFDPTQGNQNGQAVAATAQQTPAWGSGDAPSGKATKPKAE